MYKIKLSDIAKITMGQSPAGDTCNEEGIGIPLLNGPAEFTTYYPIECQYTTDAKRLSEFGDILFCVRGSTTGRMNWSDKKYAIGRGLAAITHKDDKSLNFYIKYLIEHNLKALLNYANGSTFPNLTNDLLKGFELYVHDSQAIRKISDFLCLIDSKIELNNRINAELEAMAKTLYDYWFVQFDFPDANGKPYKSSGGKMVWNKELKREIPEGWKVSSLWDIAVYTNGLAMQKFRPEPEADSLRVIKIREMNGGFSDNTEFARFDIPEKVKVYNGDILFSWSASLEVMIWTKGMGALNQHIFKITSSKYPKSFYYYQIVNYLKHFKMMAETRKTTMGHITKDHLKQSNIVLPPKELTLALQNKLEPIFTKKLNNDLQNQQLTELRDWLLPMLMNGQVTVTETEKKVAMAAEPEVAFGKQGKFGF